MRGLKGLGLSPASPPSLKLEPPLARVGWYDWQAGPVALSVAPAEELLAGSPVGSIEMLPSLPLGNES